MRNANRNERVRESIMRFQSGYLQESSGKLFNALPAPEVARAVREQVLRADRACQDVVVRYCSERVARREAHVSLSTGPYCKARQSRRWGWWRGWANWWASGSKAVQCWHGGGASSGETTQAASVTH